MALPLIVHGVVGLDTLETPCGSAAGVLGGSAPYAALGARLFADEVTMLGIVGSDFPASFVDALADCGIDLAYLDRSPGETFVWEARYEEDMNWRSTLDTRLGVLEGWRLNLAEPLRRGAMVLATNVTPSQQLELLDQCEAPAFVMADFMASWIHNRRTEVEAVMARSDLVLLNDEEAFALTGERGAIAAAEAALAFGPRYVVVKQGAYGATLMHRASSGELMVFRSPAWPLKRPVDPTGAGDTFMGAFGGYLSTCLGAGSPGEIPRGEPRWEDLKEAMACGAVAAAIACESFGPEALLKASREQVRRRLAAFAAMTCWTTPGEACIVPGTERLQA